MKTLMTILTLRLFTSCLIVSRNLLTSIARYLYSSERTISHAIWCQVMLLLNQLSLTGEKRMSLKEWLAMIGNYLSPITSYYILSLSSLSSFKKWLAMIVNGHLCYDLLRLVIICQQWFTSFQRLPLSSNLKEWLAMIGNSHLYHDLLWLVIIIDIIHELSQIVIIIVIIVRWSLWSWMGRHRAWAGVWSTDRGGSKVRIHHLIWSSYV